MCITPQQDTKIVEPSNNTLKFDAIDEKNSYRSFVLANMVEKDILNVL